MNADFPIEILDLPQEPQTIDEWKELRITQLYAEKNHRLDQLLLLSDGETMRSQGETLAWSGKVAQAKLFADSGNLDDCPLLVTETTAYLGGEPTRTEILSGVENLARRLIIKEPLLTRASGQIVGSAGRLEEQIRNAVSIEEVQAIDLAQGWV